MPQNCKVINVCHCTPHYAISSTLLWCHFLGHLGYSWGVMLFILSWFFWDFGFIFLWILGDRLSSILINFGGFTCLLLWWCIILLVYFHLYISIWPSAAIVGPCHQDMACTQVADGEQTPIWRVAANIFNKQSRTAAKGLSSSLAVG